MDTQWQIEVYLDTATDRFAESAYRVPMARNWHDLGRGHYPYINHDADSIPASPLVQPHRRPARWPDWLKRAAARVQHRGGDPAR